MHRNLTAALVSLAFAGVAISTSGCAAILLGYVVADQMGKDKATASCRANLKTINDARIREGKDVFPDQCGQ